jgi:flagellar hook-associated protein FlgK
MLIYNIGISAIRANQAALQTISNNIANADTDGYHRQRVNLTATAPLTQGNLQFGTGVQVASIDRLRNASADLSLTLNLSQSANNQAQLDALQSIETLLNPTTGSLQSSVSDFFDKVEQLASDPSESVQRTQVVAAAQAVAQQINSLQAGLDRLQSQQASAINDAVSQVNSLASQITQITQQIQTARAGGTEPATLLDQRDSLVQQLGQLVDINPGSLLDDSSPLVAAGGGLVIGAGLPPLAARQGADGALQLAVGSSQTVVQPTGGKLAGLLTVYNQSIPQTRTALEQWTSAFISGVNSVQATGLGVSGAQSLLAGTTSVTDATVPLSQAGTLFPVQKGDLYVTLTNTATGARTTSRIAIDPATDSLQDVLDRINALGSVSASVQSGSGTVRIAAAAGYTVDFAGRPDTSVDSSGITGTAVPKTAGVYDGTANANWTVTAESTGQVGITSGLKLLVTDSSTGAVVNELTVGSGYLAGQPIEIANGLSVMLSSGSLNAGDSFQVSAVSNPDSAGFLNALGIGGLFQTSDLRNISVNKQIAANSGLLATGRTGDPGDASQLNRFTDLRNARVLSGGTETLEEQLATITSNAGADVNAQQAAVDQLQAQASLFRDQQDAVSGVDPSEELMQMLLFQRAFQANAKVISSINDSLDQLLNLIR